jgi:hypothetical protein
VWAVIFISVMQFLMMDNLGVKSVGGDIQCGHAVYP